MLDLRQTNAWETYIATDLTIYSPLIYCVYQNISKDTNL